MGLFGITVDWILRQLINDGDWQLAGEFDLFDREVELIFQLRRR